MIIKNIKLTNFRNYSSYDFEPNKGLNIITGRNGIGKTNLVEAIYYTNLAKGFKNKKEIELLKENENEFLIECKIQKEEDVHNLRFYFNSKINEKKILINGKPIKKLAELNNVTNILLFTPSMCELFKNSPSERREYFDICISKLSEKYFDTFKSYKKLIKERNLLLKEENADRALLDTITNRLIPLSKTIVMFRNLYVQRINSIISNVSEYISNQNKKFELIYTPNISLNQDFEKELLKAYKNSLEKDLKLKTTTVGVHKEDFVMNINGKDISVFGSQAENRLSVVALVLSSYFVPKDKNNSPIVILDDVFSELDATNKQKIINFTKTLSQVFITTTETDEIEFEKKIMEVRS